MKPSSSNKVTSLLSFCARPNAPSCDADDDFDDFVQQRSPKRARVDDSAAEACGGGDGDGLVNTSSSTAADDGGPELEDNDGDENASPDDGAAAAGTAAKSTRIVIKDGNDNIEIDASGCEVRSEDGSDNGSDLDDFLVPDEDEDEDDYGSDDADRSSTRTSDDADDDDDQTYATDDDGGDGDGDGVRFDNAQIDADKKERLKRRLEKDLDGIETANILGEGSRRTRRSTLRFVDDERYGFKKEIEKQIINDEDIDGLSDSESVSSVSSEEESDGDWCGGDDEDSDQ
jgi:hypothetical protein